jgi:hypothetical protein
MLQQNVLEGQHKRKLTKRSLETKILRFHTKNLFTLRNCKVISCCLHYFFATVNILFILLANYTTFHCILLMCIYEHHYALYVLNQYFLATSHKFLA